MENGHSFCEAATRQNYFFSIAIALLSLRRDDVTCRPEFFYEITFTFRTYFDCVPKHRPQTDFHGKYGHRASLFIEMKVKMRLDVCGCVCGLRNALEETKFLDIIEKFGRCNVMGAMEGNESAREFLSFQNYAHRAHSATVCIERFQFSLFFFFFSCVPFRNVGGAV